jgi:tripartite-type tricarboxylate transporter receptor subunit TctC
MKLPHRRQVLHLAAGAAAFPTVSRIAWAQIYPARPVRLIVGFAPGGSADIKARLLGQQLSERVGQQFIIENRTGAGSNIAAEAVVRAAPDGYTLLLSSTANSINASLYEKLNFNFIRDIAPVASLSREPNVMVVTPSFPAKTVPEFIAYAKANPGKIAMGSPGSGTSQHLSGELFKMLTGINMVHVPYRGGVPAITDLLGGQVQVVFSATSDPIASIRAGKLRALAITTATRSEALPEVPAVAEFVPGYEASAWYGIGAPKGTSAEVIDRLNKEIDASFADPKMKAQLADLGILPAPMTPPEFGKFVADQTEKWAKVVRAVNIKAE